MKSIKTITFQLVRTYSKFGSAGIRNKMKLLTTDKDSKIKLEDFNTDDPEIYELDFMNADKLNAMHDREKEKSTKVLPYHIVKSKYFKQVEPSFLTYAEKDQIKKLHNSDPEEWTLEKLSQSFPALPHTIKKILRSNWEPKSVDVIIKYDNKVIENWKNFKCDKLALNPALKNHLMKFRNRKISLPDRESLERFVPCQIVIPKPKSTTFRSIIKAVMDDEQHISNEQSVSSKKIEKNLITVEKKTVDIGMNEGNNYKQLVPSRRVYSDKGERLVFTDFMKKKLNDSDQTSPEEKETLLSIYRKHIETTNLEDVSNNVSTNDTKYINNSNETSPEEKETLLSTYRKHIETTNLEDVSNNVSTNDTKYINNSNETSPEEKETLLSTYRQHIETTNLEDVSNNVSTNDTKYINNSNETSPEEKETLLSTYRQHIETTNLEDVNNNVSTNDTKYINNVKDIVHNEQDLSKNSALTVQSENQSEIAAKIHVEYKGVETYVKERISLMETNFDYINRIQIPKNAFKKGMTYRIKDCYYDDDGEFLYRTPGLKS